MGFTPDALLSNTYCLHAVSKDVTGEVLVLDADHKSCADPGCESLVLVTFLRLKVQAGPCDSPLGRLLDGAIRIRDFTTVFAGKSETLRGVHAGTPLWTPAAGGMIKGTVEGISNAGTARQPLQDCERCDRVGLVSGHLFGAGSKVPGVPVPDFNVDLVYRLMWDPLANVQGTAPVRGTLEGVIVLPCR